MPTLIVATHQQWRAHDLAAAADGNWTVQHSLGLDIPHQPDWSQVRWWTPQEHAARLAHAGLPLTLQAPDPYWLTRQPSRLVARDVWVGPLSTIGDGPNRAWWKPATIKCDSFAATFTHRDSVYRWADRERDAGRNPDVLLVQASADAAWQWEARCIVIGGAVAGAAVYCDSGHTWDGGLIRDDGRAGAAAEWLTFHLGTVDLPDAAAVDVGWHPQTGFSLVEANPVWASAWYGIHPRAVIAAADAAGNPHSPAAQRWAWQPDPYLLDAAARRRRLTFAAPVRRAS